MFCNKFNRRVRCFRVYSLIFTTWTSNDVLSRHLYDSPTSEWNFVIYIFARESLILGWYQLIATHRGICISAADGVCLPRQIPHLLDRTLQSPVELHRNISSALPGKHITTFPTIHFTPNFFRQVSPSYFTIQSDQNPPTCHFQPFHLKPADNPASPALRVCQI